jgi:FAD/FMN-containing dehydrogenase
MTKISSWGRLSQSEHQLLVLSDRDNAIRSITHNQPGLVYGNGRSYGDVCLNPDGVLWKTTGLNHFIQFDCERGILECESGLLLSDIQRVFVPQGWMLPVTPGTQMATVGGAIANDVHGKNHHMLGSFGDHVLSIKLLRTNGEIIECGPNLHREWFGATVGGLGLTGVILSVNLQLRPVHGAWIESETIPYQNLSEFFHLADTSEAEWEYTVSWVDCLSSTSRGLFMRGNHVQTSVTQEVKKRVLTVPVTPPLSLVNKLSLTAFNALYFNTKKHKTGKEISHYESFFYPLDNLLEWNRMYGPKGFYQYQSVVPRESGEQAIEAMLSEIRRSGEGSFLAVLKTFGHRRSQGMLSFPMPGVTLALDFPNKGEKTLSLFNNLDAIVRAAGGRIYPAKDARMPRSLFEAGYPRINEFLPYRDAGISSSMSRRLLGS